MKKLPVILILIALLAVPVHGEAIEAPRVGGNAQQYMPEDTQSFAEGFFYIVSVAISKSLPDLADACRIGLILLAMGLITTLISTFSGPGRQLCGLVCVISTGTILIGSSQSLIGLGIQTVEELDDYGKLLLPVLTTALASTGAVSKSAVLFAGCSIFSALLTSAITALFVPMLYVYLALSIADRSVCNCVFSNIKKFIKWLMTWLLKLILYIFTGYVAVSGIISGSADAVTIKATKITLSGMIPVVGGIISDASEAILVSASLMKNTAGIYGIYAFLAICIGPILRILAHSVILKVSGTLTGMFSIKEQSDIIEDFSQGMSMLMAATGTCCLLLLISTVSFIKGVNI